MRIYIIAIITLGITACNDSQSSTENPVASLSDSLLQQVIDGHDVAMPKMMKLERLQKTAQAEMDSLKKTNGNKARVALLSSTTKSLVDANTAMHQWMQGFKYDSLKDNEPARVAYLKEQLVSVNLMKEQVLSSLAKADSVLTQ